MRMKDKNSFLIFIVVNGQNGAFCVEFFFVFSVFLFYGMVGVFCNIPVNFWERLYLST